MNLNGNEFFRDGENREKRLKQIKSFYEYLATCRGKRIDSDELDANWASIFSIFERIKDLESQNETLEESFYNYLLSLKYPCLDIDDNLIEMYIRYSIMYLDDYDYNLKLNGLNLIDHLLEHLTSSKLGVNMRAVLLYNSLLKYAADKESRVFLGRIMPTMCLLLNKIETKFARGDHCYSQHSVVVDSLLNACYMSTDFQVKTIFIKSLHGYLTQMGDYSCRHLEKYLTVAFDFLDSVKTLKTNSMNEESTEIDTQLQVKQDLAEVSIDFVLLLIDLCSLRIHAHARRILNFCLKILYFYSFDSNNDEADTINDPIVVKIQDIIARLFKIEKVKNQLYEEFRELQNSENSLNPNFRFLIRNL
jgi:hypothetical protein